MAKTKLEIAVKVLRKLGRLPDGQVAPASQTAIVEDSYDGLYSELEGRALVSWSATDDIPDFAAHYIVILLCGRVADDFGVDGSFYISQLDFAEFRLAELLSNIREDETTPGVYF